MSFGSYQPPPLPPSGPPMSNYASNQSAPYMIAPPPPPSYGIPLPPPSSDEYSWNSWNSTPAETPHSPPHFERKGHEGNMIEYIDDSLRAINEASDIDHRQLMAHDPNGEFEESCSKSLNWCNFAFADVDHRNLISLTGSPGLGNNNSDSVSSWLKVNYEMLKTNHNFQVNFQDHRKNRNQMKQTNGNDQFMNPPPTEPPPIFNKFLVRTLKQLNKLKWELAPHQQAMSESIDPSMSKYPPNNRNQRPALLPTPSHPPRYNRNMSDSSRSMNVPDDIETVDMEMSDDDTGIDNRSVGSSGGEISFAIDWIQAHHIIFRSTRLLNAKHVSFAASNQHEQATTSADARQWHEPAAHVVDS